MQPLQIWIGPTIRIGREIWCLPYAGFFALWAKNRQVALLVADPPPAYSTTDTDTHTPYGDHMVDLIFGQLNNWLSFITRQN